MASVSVYWKLQISILSTRVAYFAAASAPFPDAIEFDLQMIAQEKAMTRYRLSVILITATVPALLGGMALGAQDKYTLQVPNGLAFSDFRGYENWEAVAVSQTESGIKVIVANPPMMAAYKDGLPADGKLFPDGSKVAKIEWTFKRNTVSPYFVNVPDTLKSLSFIEKDVRRFPNTHGWAYAQFMYDPAADTFAPDVQGAECGYACHTTVAAKDYIFTAYPKR
jgi:Cytochrome P460